MFTKLPCTSIGSQSDLAGSLITNRTTCPPQRLFTTFKAVKVGVELDFQPRSRTARGQHGSVLRAVAEAHQTVAREKIWLHRDRDGLAGTIITLRPGLTRIFSAAAQSTTLSARTTA
ncbi:hypothetical protein BASA81_001930 [Batrachochytrium salamandrivorans]|nr:hypothetical protein BASA81_001930 [Batrachochytrium salamandrivorans]